MSSECSGSFRLQGGHPLPGTRGGLQRPSELWRPSGKQRGCHPQDGGRNPSLGFQGMAALAFVLVQHDGYPSSFVRLALPPWKEVL